MTEDRTLRDAAIVAGVIGGVLIILGGIGMLAMAPMMRMMMGTGFGMMMWLAPVWSILTGGAALYAAFRLRAGDDDASAWGVVLIVAAVLSLPVGGGFLLGAASAAVGGILALMSRTRSGARSAGSD